MRFTLKIWRHASYSLATHHYAAGTSYEKLWHESSHHQALAVFSFPAPKEPGYLFLYLDVWDPSRRIWAIDLKELYTCQLATPRSETWPHSDLPFKISLKTAIFTDIARQRPTRLVIELQTKKKKNFSSVNLRDLPIRPIKRIQTQRWRPNVAVIFGSVSFLADVVIKAEQVVCFCGEERSVWISQWRRSCLRFNNYRCYRGHTMMTVLSGLWFTIQRLIQGSLGWKKRARIPNYLVSCKG